MRFGIVILPQDPWSVARRKWLEAEQYGFDHAFTYGHLSWRSLADEPWNATIPTLTAAAAVTERIILGTCVSSPNFRHPVPFAKDVATVDDVVSGDGRDPVTIDRYLSLDSGGTYSLQSMDAFEDAVGRAAELGFTDVISHWPRENGIYSGDESILGTVAAVFT